MWIGRLEMESAESGAGRVFRAKESMSEGLQRKEYGIFKSVINELFGECLTLGNSTWVTEDLRTKFKGSP